MFQPRRTQLRGFSMFLKDQVIELDMDVDEALKYIISMGVRSTAHPSPATWFSLQNLLSISTLSDTTCVPTTADNQLTDQVSQEVVLCGWAHRRRDHGGVIFIDLRDREGLAQVVCDPDRPDRSSIAESVRNEYCLKITGTVRARPCRDGQSKYALSGEVEVLCHSIDVLNPSVTPPFHLDERENLLENAWLTHRSPICAVRRCRRTCCCVTRRRVLSAASWTTPVLSTSKRRC